MESHLQGVAQNSVEATADLLWHGAIMADNACC
jgi:uncharacterized Zn finger protein (UPF0148 family)